MEQQPVNHAEEVVAGFVICFVLVFCVIGLIATYDRVMDGRTEHRRCTQRQGVWVMHGVEIEGRQFRCIRRPVVPMDDISFGSEP